jgi:predicted DNA-binding protein
MSITRISIRIPQHLGERLQKRSQLKGKPESALVREALESYFGEESVERTAFELAMEAGVIGRVHEAPKDLSTNSDHFEGFGKSS